MKKSIWLMVGGILLIPFLVNGQEGLFFSAGWNYDKLLKTEPLSRIIQDFNQHHSSNGYILNSPLEVPDNLDGVHLGIKMVGEVIDIHLDLHGRGARTTSGFTDSLSNSLERQLKISHSGFSMGFGYKLVYTKGFGMGPVFNLTFEQFRAKTMYSNNLIEPDQKIPVKWA
jgi:hypothetical protein